MKKLSSGAVAVVLLPLVSLTLLLGLVVLMNRPDGCGPTGTPGSTVDVAGLPDVPGYTRDQVINAAHIMNAASALGLDRRAQTVGVMTALGESSLLVLDRGDIVGPDSRGLFQQRANGAWGSYADRMDPTTSATNFFRALTAVPGWETLEPTLAANATQNNADPWHYSHYQGAADELVARLAAPAPAPVTAALAPAPGGADRYSLGPVKPHLASMVAEVGPAFGFTTVGGWRANARDPNGHPSGLAADLMTSSVAQGDAAAEYLIANAARLNVDYILWRQRSWSVARADEGWRPMADRGNATVNHYDHLHVNVTPSATGAGGQPGAGCLPGATPAGGGTDGWAVPVQAVVTSDYGPRVHPVTGQRRQHAGADFGAACGTPIAAAGPGRVVRAGAAGGYGNLIVLDHGGGLTTRYGHMYAAGVGVRVGDTVTAGQRIGAVGSAGTSTGCHLHLEVRRDGVAEDPAAFLAAHGVPV